MLKRFLLNIFAASLIIFSPLVVQGQEPGHIPIQSDFLSADVKGAYVFSSEEEMGIALYGKLPGQESVSKLGRISTLYSDEDTRVNIEEVSTEKHARGLGVATALYEYVIKAAESYSGKRVTHLGGTSKVGTNRDAILLPLIESLRSKNGFVEPTPTADLQTQFHECCSKIYSDYPELILQSTAHSPTAKIGKKLGFEIDPESVEFSLGTFEDKPHVHIKYVQVRK
jgi:GNAT superfamily N-acetyltransferase